MADGNSRFVTSNQLGVHDKLDEVVKKHLASEFKKPFAQHSVDAFAVANDMVLQTTKPLILDSCCGVGESTANLAALYPDHLVVGVDKSDHRVAKHDLAYRNQQDNYLLVRADLNDFWRLALQHDWQQRIAKHFILYPNPWPKSAHLKRRWHGTAVFPTILQLGGELLVRSNWRIYIEEFQRALELAGQDSHLELYHSEQPITPFERKYWASGQQSWQVTAQL
jgi:tRNA G46 methylase TrmB